MNPDKYINKKHVEANVIDEKVDDFYEEHPRSRKSADTVAEEIIKDGDDLPIRINTVPEETGRWYQSMSDAGMRVLTNGFMDISRWEKDGPRKSVKHKLVRQKIDGLPSAIRMQDHILGLYREDTEERDSEHTKLESIEEIIAYANDLLNHWSEVDEVGKKELQQQLASVVLELERCRNEFKIEIKDRAEATMKLQDSRGRENPSALAARTVGALNSLTKRISEMQLIMPMVAMRKEMLVLEKRRVEKEMDKANSKLNLLLNHPIFKTDDKRAPESRLKEHETTALQLRVQQAVEFLNTIHVAPYYQQAEQAKFFLREIFNLLNSQASILENVDRIRDKIKDVQFILTSKIEHFG